MWSVLLTVGAVAVCIAMLVVAQRIEPVWVSKDRQRFLTTCQPIDRLGQVIGRKREIKGSIAEGGDITLSSRAFLRTTRSTWRVEAKSPKPPSGKQLYILRPVPPADDGSKLILRVPTKSELVGVLDQVTPTAP